MEAPRSRQKALTLSAPLSPAAQRRLTHFKAFAISHPLLQRVDTTLMRAIREPAGFSHVLVYGPSGVGKSTMMRQIAQRLNSAERGPLWVAHRPSRCCCWRRARQTRPRFIGRTTIAPP